MGRLVWRKRRLGERPGSALGGNVSAVALHKPRGEWPLSASLSLHLEDGRRGLWRPRRPETPSPGPELMSCDVLHSALRADIDSVRRFG